MSRGVYFPEISILGIIQELEGRTGQAFTSIATGTMDRHSPGQDTVKMSQTRIRTLMVAVLVTQSLELRAMEKPLCCRRG